MSSVDPNDIAISILKDAAASAIAYCVLLAANGVILITTKKGKPKDVPLYLTMDMQAGKVPHVCPFLDSYNYAVLC